MHLTCIVHASYIHALYRHHTCIVQTSCMYCTDIIHALCRHHACIVQKSYMHCTDILHALCRNHTCIVHHTCIVQILLAANRYMHMYIHAHVHVIPNEAPKVTHYTGNSRKCGSTYVGHSQQVLRCHVKCSLSLL